MNKHLFLKSFFSILLALIFLTGGIPALANTSFQEGVGGGGLLPDSPVQVFQERSDDPTILRTRYVDVQFNLLPDPGQPVAAQARQGQPITLNLFPDAVYTAVEDRLEAGFNGAVSWVGHLEGVELSEVTLVVDTNGIMAGNITFPGAVYQIRYVMPGVHAVHQIDQSRFPDEADIPIVDQISTESPTVTPPAPEADDGSTIDVMVVYTPAARIAAGGTDAMNTLINLAITETNTGYSNSQITQRVQLVHYEEVNYTETSSNAFNNALDAVTKADGQIDNVRTLRDDYGADLVSFWIEDDEYCGLGWMMTNVSSSFAPYGYNVVARSCATGNYTIAHEMGHNMGATHDWYVDTTTNQPYTYNKGYVNLAKRWRTIMAYNSYCYDNGVNCTRLNYWSNPSVNYGGNPMGVPEGQSKQADNHKVLNNTAYTVANFRASTFSSLSIIQPLESAPANAGPYNSPNNILVKAKYVPGVGKNEFSITIGGLAANIVTMYETSGVYTMEVTPPVQPANGTYSITVSARGKSATETNAVIYGEPAKQVIFRGSGAAQSGVVNQHSVQVDSSVTDATFSVTWTNSSSQVSLRLVTPGGTVIDSSTTDPNVEYTSDATSASYQVSPPTLAAGDWTMEVTLGNFSSSADASSGEPYMVEVLGITPVSMTYLLDDSTYNTEDTVKMLATLADTSPILGASVVVTVQPPASADAADAAEPDSLVQVTLYDDGRHGDYLSSDGIYANDYSGVSTAGTASYTVTATGVSHVGLTFIRQIETTAVFVENPNTLRPVEGSRVLTWRPFFDWDDESGADRYQLQVSKKSNFKSLVLSKTTLVSSYQAVKDLPGGVTLYWRTRARISGVWQNWKTITTVHSFISANPPKTITLVSPRNKKSVSTLTPKMDWKNVSLPKRTFFDHYQLQIATDANFSAVVLDQDVKEGVKKSEYTLTSPLAALTTYYWRVRAFNTDGQYGNWSLVRKFKTK